MSVYGVVKPISHSHQSTLRMAAVLLLLYSGWIPLALADPAAGSNASTIVHDADQQLWTIANGTVEWQVSGDPGARDAGLMEVRLGQSQAWTIAKGADGQLTIDGRAREIGRRHDGFVVDHVSSMSVGNGVQLDIAMRLADLPMAITRHYALYDESPALELWTTVQSLDFRPHALSDLNGFTIIVPSGVAHWVNGLQGDNADVRREAAFTMQTHALNDGESLTIGSTRRSSEQQLPWITVVNSSSTFFAGVMWSGAWSLTATRAAGATQLKAGLAPMETALTSGDSIEGPHVLIGAIAGGTSGVSRAMERFITNGLRSGRLLAPVVTFNTWFAYGVRIDEASMRAEMDRAAALGAELFVIDAGWYAGVGADGAYDFESGLGTWEGDAARFPSGLKALSDYAHALGIRFGLWLEPERINLSTIGASGVEERWLATSAGAYQSARTAQICLAGHAAREYIFRRLAALIDSVQPDYLKWDNNFWINCDREGHDHGPSDGNFAHTQGLYDVLGRLRERYPSLLIENVSGGGNRLDLGMLRYSDVAWMDDRTAPSVLVRHNLEGLSSILPPAYLLSFAVDHAGESLHQASDLALYLRSRMEGVLGLCFRTGDFSEEELGDIAAQIATYKSFRDALATGSATLLTAQAAVTSGPAWDVLQIGGADGEGFVISAFQADPGTGRVRIPLSDLDPSATYDVRSVDAGPLGSATGSDLMSGGIELGASADSAAHILILTRTAAAESLRRR